MTTQKPEVKRHANKYIETYTGKKFYVFDPQPDDISIVDIAHALSMMCRFTGHSRQFYSVAEHSINVAEYVGEEDKQLAMWGLLHDSSEAYLADIASPVKPLLNNYAELERNIMKVICDKFNLECGMPPEVHHADVEMLRTEAYQLMLSKGVNWRANMESDTPIREVTLECYRPDQAKLFFLEKFFMLGGQ